MGKKKKLEARFTGKPNLVSWPAISWAAISEELTEYSKRGFVLACGSIVDRALERLLTAKFKMTRGVEDGEIAYLLGTGKHFFGPLAHMGVRARIARVLGLIDKRVCQALRDFTDMRNHFAHNEMPAELDNSIIAPIYANLPAEYHTKSIPPDGGQLLPNKFLLAVTTMMLSVLYRAEVALEAKDSPSPDSSAAILPPPDMPLS
jgi:DNA-binding MltR family transcriptional regulator